MSELCLVTGGAGFIGSHLVDALGAAGQTVRVLDNLETGLLSNLEAARPAPELINADLRDAEAVERAMKDVRVVYHLAALPSVQRSAENPLGTHEACATGSLNILNAARRHAVRRVVYAASSSCYGGASSADGQAEDLPLKPMSPYAAAKLAGELYAHAFWATYGLDTVRLRFFNIFGPRQRADSPYSGVIAKFIAEMINGRVPTIFGNGLQSRDFTYVANAVQALMRAAEAPNVAGRVYNIGTGRSVNLLELTTALNRLLHSSITPRLEAARAGDVKYSKANIGRAREELGYDPRITFEEGLEKTLHWYRQLTH